MISQSRVIAKGRGIRDVERRPYLYPHEVFTVVDAREPEDWVTVLGEDNERYAYPPLLADSGFFEDYFDGHPEAIATFWRVMNRRLSSAA